MIMKIYTFNKNTSLRSFISKSICQNIFFEIDKNGNIKYLFGLCILNADNKPGIIEIDYNESIDKYYNVTLNTSTSDTFDKDKYINKKYFKLYGEYKSLNTLKDFENFFAEELILFDLFISSNTFISYATNFLKMKNNKLTEKIFKHTIIPSYISQETINNLLKEYQDINIKYELNKQTYKWYKDKKFWITKLIEIIFTSGLSVLIIKYLFNING